jgi:ATP-binding cassette subfamily B protein
MGDAILACARAVGLPAARADSARVPVSGTLDTLWLDGALGRAASRLGLEVEAVSVPLSETASLVRRASPMLVRLAANPPKAAGAIAESDRLLVVARARRGRLTVITPDGRSRRVTEDVLCRALATPREAEYTGVVEGLLALADVPARRRDRARQAFLAQRTKHVALDVCWSLRLPPSAPFTAQLALAGVTKRLAFVLSTHLAQLVLGVLAWWTLGLGAFAGHLDPGWLIAWALLLVTQVPLRMFASREQGEIGVDVGILLRRRLLAGALRRDGESTRTEGSGRMLSRVLESESIERLVLGAGSTAILSSIELLVAAALLANGAYPIAQVGLLATFSALAAGLGLALLRRRGAWTDARLALTYDTIERLQGHRTRLIQERAETWHDAEDAALAEASLRAQAMDRVAATLVTFVPRGWFVASLVLLTPELVLRGGATASVALTLGGAIMAMQALRRFTQGVDGLAGATVAWRRVQPLFDAAAAPAEPVSTSQELLALPTGSPIVTAATITRPLLLAGDVVFRHRGRELPVLTGGSLAVQRGERVLVEGRSGSGKSTLVALLAGLRDPESGRVAFDGIDRRALGPLAWRTHIACAPQLHENHVFSTTFAFNLLLGRGWPPTLEDLEEAEILCGELGLGDLLERMPAGLLQIVGETGWQLSHGERSRLFVARALLQRADVVLLDESFAALDPATSRLVMECVRRRASTLVVVAHP